jgi:tRNA-dihydrouridine synthase B
MATLTRRRKAREVLARTGADAVMIGRAAQGRPWIFREVAHYLAPASTWPAPWWPRCGVCCWSTCSDHHGLYGEHAGVRSARKHIGWYVYSLPGGEALRQQVNVIESAEQQLAAVANYFDGLARLMDRLPLAPGPTSQTEQEEASA